MRDTSTSVTFGDVNNVSFSTGKISYLRQTKSKHEYGRSPEKRSLLYHLNTLLLFTVSDFKTVIIPQVIFAWMAVLSPTKMTTVGTDIGEVMTASQVYGRLPHLVAWLWIHLLVENIANQRAPDSILEDQVNKPWRPIPSKRLSPDEARHWLRAAVIIAAGTSFLLGGMDASLSFIALVWMYNDLGGSGCGCITRNALNAGGLMCFSWGGLSILSGGELLPAARLWIWTTGAIIMTTVQAQDLPDMGGDKARGRLTAPLVYGDGVTRWLFAATTAFWSVVAPLLWNASLLRLGMILATGATMAWLSVMRCGPQWDEVVWKLWCFWMVAIYALPTSHA